MKVTVNEVDQHKVTLHIEVSAEDAAKGAAAAVKNLANRVNIPGFRKGKAPRMVLESFLGKDAVKEEIFEVVASKAYNDALQEQGITPVTDPDINRICDEKGKDFVFEATLTKKPEVNLGEYKGIKAAKEAVEVTDEDVAKELVNLQKTHAKMAPAPEGAKVEDGDYAVIDFKGTIDGVAFEGGEGKAYPLQIGSGSFIPGFEEQLIGLKAGDSKDVKVPFPEDYFQKDLAGKEAVALNLALFSRRPRTSAFNSSTVLNLPTSSAKSASTGGNSLRLISWTVTANTASLPARSFWK